jgi:hypothetical protein
MVAKITTGSKLYGALLYNIRKVEEGQGKVLEANFIPIPEDGKFSVPACKEVFDAWLPAPDSIPTAKPLIHISLNPHPEDKLTDEQLAAIGQEYMERLGYGGQPYMIFKHEDIERQHIHIVSIRVDSEGKLIKDSFEHRRSKEITGQLEREYNLHPAEGQKPAEAWRLSPVDISRGNLKRQIASALKPLAGMYHFQTMGEYRALLSLCNVCIEEVKGETHGKPYRGLLYSALDREGNKMGTPLKASLFGNAAGYEALEKQMAQAAGKVKMAKETTRMAVAQAMKDALTESEFRASLQAKDIDLVLRRNDEGRLYGVTFIDHTSRCVINGSRLGKAFSANALNERFGGEQMEGTAPGDSHSPSAPSVSTPGEHLLTLMDSLGEAACSLPAVLSPGISGDDEDRRLPRKPLKKKKRRYGRQV